MESAFFVVFFVGSPMSPIITMTGKRQVRQIASDLLAAGVITSVTTLPPLRTALCQAYLRIAWIMGLCCYYYKT